MEIENLEEGALRVLFQKMNKVEKYIVDNRNEYQDGANIFSSSVPPELDNKESIVKYFKKEIRKLNFVASKLNGWLEAYEQNDLKISIIKEYKRKNFKNLTIKELYLTFSPINPNTNKEYTLRTVRNLINNTAMVEPNVRAGTNKYSPDDFERFLVRAGISYNKIISDRILSFLEEDQSKRTLKETHTYIKALRLKMLITLGEK